jgi:hypothetical protein
MIEGKQDIVTAGHWRFRHPMLLFSSLEPEFSGIKSDFLMEWGK